MPAYSLSVKALKQGVLRKCGEPVDGSSIYDTNGDVLDLLNRAHLKVLAGGNEFVPQLARPWAWANPQKFIIELQPPFQTGGVTMTSGSSSITFDTPPAYSLAGWWIKIIGRPEWFKITTHTASAGAATIDCNYTDVTASALSFMVVQLEYNVNPTPGVLRMYGPATVYRPQDMEGDAENKIYMSDETAMTRDYPLSQILQRIPTRFCEMSRDTFGSLVLRFNAYVLNATKVEIPYIPYPAALLDTPTYPFYATVTIASPGVWSKVAHGLSNGDPLVLSTTGALPTGYVVGVTYYVVNKTANTFQLSAVVGGSAIAASGTQSGTHTITPAQPAQYSLVPQDHVEIMEYIASAWLCIIKNDDRAQAYEAKAAAAGVALMGAYAKERTESSKDRGRLVPRMDNFWEGRRTVSQEVTPGGS